MSSSEKIDLYLSEAQNPILLPPLQTEYVYTVYTGWQRYFRNTSKASLSHKKSTYLLISFALKCLSSLQKWKQKQTYTFWQK